VLRLDAPEWPRVPDSPRRADGESIHRAHGCEQYATCAQLSLRAQLLSGAQSAPRRNFRATWLLGANPAQLDVQLRADAHDRRG